MKQLGVFLLPPKWDASPSQGYPPHPGGERHRGSKESRPRTQHNVPGQGLNLDRSLQSQVHHEATAPPREAQKEEIICALPGREKLSVLIYNYKNLLKLT